MESDKSTDRLLSLTDNLKISGMRDILTKAYNPETIASERNKGMQSDFFRGASYVTEGVSVLLKNKYLWKYAALPVGFTGLVSAGFLWMVVKFTAALAEKAGKISDSLPSWAGFAGTALAGVVWLVSIAGALLILYAVAEIIYEMFGSLFFDTMAERFEKEMFHYVPAKASGKQYRTFCLECFLHGLGSALIFPWLFLLSFFVPVAGQFLLTAVMGKRLAVSCLMSTAFNHRLDRAGLRRRTAGAGLLLTGYGMTAYFLMMIPFLSVFVLPGAILGGTLLCRRELSGFSDAPRRN